MNKIKIKNIRLKRNKEINENKYKKTSESHPIFNQLFSPP